MMVVVAYDVATTTPEGRRRLSHVAKTCLDYGQRVQNSVFECSVTPEQWVNLKGKLLDIVDLEEDSLRFYFLGANWRRRVEHHGAKQTWDPDGPLLI
ncbi:MAG: CRISPR-associated endonuclease Cas2 [Planctomycetota bacterium]|nr:MAG: CRISPR-associated endonuclease Cas2 [Planctomycetota bacterium]